MSRRPRSRLATSSLLLHEPRVSGPLREHMTARGVQKIAYGDAESAKQAVIRNGARRSYQCSICGMWHLSSKSETQGPISPQPRVGEGE